MKKILNKKNIIISILLLLVTMFSLCGCNIINKFIIENKEKSIDITEENKETIKETIKDTEKKGVLYQGAAPGYNDLINVDVYLDGLHIEDIKVTSHKETPGIGGELKDKNGKVITIGGESPITLIPRLMVENQSINVDTVTGATVTSYGIAHAVVDAMVKAGIRVDATTAPTEIVDEEHKNNVDYVLSEEEEKLYAPYLERAHIDDKEYVNDTDVIIIGGGGAGLSAALRVLEKNTKVVLIEKNGEVGGDTLVCGAIFNAPDRELQKKLDMTDAKFEVINKAILSTPKEEEEKKIQDKVYEELGDFNLNNEKGVFDSKTWFMYQTWLGGDRVGNLNLIKILADNSYTILNKLKSYGMEFYDYVSQGAGSLWERTHTSKMQMGTGLISTLLNAIEKYKNNINIYTHLEAKELIYNYDSENDIYEVTGVKCVDKHGKEITINSKYGVIIATGGFSANKEMVENYNVRWQDLSNVGTTNRFTCSQGDGINMALSVNADLTDMKEIQLLYLGNTKNSQLSHYPKRDVNATDQIIFIDEYGRRFTNEGGRRDEISRSILRLKRNYFYILESGDGKDYVDIYGKDFSSADGFSLDSLIRDEYIIVADTLEELATKLNMDYDTLKETIDTFNDCVDGVREDEYGRTLYSTKLTKGPYIATPRVVSVHHTMGGIKINENAEVIDKNGNVIKGLFAAGEVTGGIHGANRLGGNAVTDICVFGNIAGDSITKEKEKIETKTLNIDTNDNFSGEGMRLNSINKSVLSLLDNKIKDNIIFSNVGIQSILKMVNFAASGNTKNEIEKINGDFNKDLNSQAVNIYNYMAINENNNDAKVKKSFIDTLKNTNWIKSDVYEINNNNTASKVAKNINDKILKETNGQIKDGVSKDSYEKDDFLMQLGNVIHFNGTWDKITKDNPYKTKNLYFTNDDNEKAVTDFIIVNEDDARLIENEDIIGMSLDYKEEDNRYEFIAFLTKDENEKDINNIDVTHLNYYKKDCELNVKFPKFEFNNNIDLIPIMKALGIKDLFDKNNSDLSNGFETEDGNNVYASAFNQKCAIKVDEVGTEASALTTIDFEVLGATIGGSKRQVTLTFNRPFYFFIFDKKENIPLFIGKIKNMEDNGKEVADIDKNIPTIIDIME